MAVGEYFCQSGPNSDPKQKLNSVIQEFYTSYTFPYTLKILLPITV